MGYADGCSFADSGMIDQYRFDFGRPYALAGDFDRVVRTSKNVPEPVFVYGGPIAVNPDVFESRPVSFEVALFIPPKPARHADPWRANHQLTDLTKDRGTFCIYHISSHSRASRGEGCGF